MVNDGSGGMPGNDDDNRGIDNNDNNTVIAEPPAEITALRIVNTIAVVTLPSLFSFFANVILYLNTLASLDSPSSSSDGEGVPAIEYNDMQLQLWIMSAAGAVAGASIMAGNFGCNAVKKIIAGAISGVSLAAFITFVSNIMCISATEAKKHHGSHAFSTGDHKFTHCVENPALLFLAMGAACGLILNVAVIAPRIKSILPSCFKTDGGYDPLPSTDPSALVV